MNVLPEDDDDDWLPDDGRDPRDPAVLMEYLCSKMSHFSCLTVLVRRDGLYPKAASWFVYRKPGVTNPTPYIQAYCFICKTLMKDLPKRERFCETLRRGVVQHAKWHIDNILKGTT